MVTKQLFEINARGELVDPSLLDDITEKYTPDSLFLRNCAPYLIMAICFAIDGCFFYSLFSLISYDRPPCCCGSRLPASSLASISCLFTRVFCIKNCSRACPTTS